MPIEKCPIPDLSPNTSVVSTPKTAGEIKSGKLKEACSELESLFIYHLLKEMRETIPKSGLMGGGKTEEMYTSILDLQLSREIAGKREIGIASMLYEQFSGQGAPDAGKREDITEDQTKKS